MALRIVAIRPRSEPFATDPFALIDEELGRRGFAGDCIRDLAEYPPFKPWRSRTPKSGPRKGGRRTGTLGKGWRIARIERSANRRSVEVDNGVAYAVHVEGPRRGQRGRRQTAVMRERGWPTVTEVAQRNWRKRQPIIVRILTQGDPRVRNRRRRM